jgi:hypothetical protein
MGMDEHLKTLAASGVHAYESSFTALDAYLRLKPAPIRFALASCALQDLAKAYDELSYPGLQYADAALAPKPDSGSLGVYLRCADSPKAAESAAFPQLDLLRDTSRDVFLDPKDIYASLREKTVVMRAAPSGAAALRVGGPPVALSLRARARSRPAAPPRLQPRSPARHAHLMLTGATPERGLELLGRSVSSTLTGPSSPLSSVPNNPRNTIPRATHGPTRWRLFATGSSPSSASRSPSSFTIAASRGPSNRRAASSTGMPRSAARSPSASSFAWTFRAPSSATCPS